MRTLPYLCVACLLFCSACATTRSADYAEDISLANINDVLKGHRVKLILRDGQSYDTYSPMVFEDSTYFKVSGSPRKREMAIATAELERLVRRPSTNRGIIGGVVGAALGTLIYLGVRNEAEKCNSGNCVGAALSVTYARVGIFGFGALGALIGVLSEGESEVYRIVVEEGGRLHIAP